MATHERRLKLGEAIRGPKPIIGVNVWDCLSALIAQRAGFDYVSVSGYQVAATAIGKLDIGLTTMTEMVNATRNIANSVNIPVLTDAEQGYGTAIHVIRTVKELEKAGAQGMMIDDKVVETCPWLPDKSLANRYFRGVISEEEMVGKVKAAVHARSSKDFVIKFRSNIRGPNLRDPAEPAVKRCRLALEAGADIVHANVKSFEELKMWDSLEAPLDVSLAHTFPLMRQKTFTVIADLSRHIRTINAGTGGIRYVAKSLLAIWTQVRREELTGPLNANEMPHEEWMDLFDVQELSGEIERFIPAIVGRKPAQQQA